MRLRQDLEASSSGDCELQSGYRVIELSNIAWMLNPYFAPPKDQDNEMHQSLNCS
jgi:hypothetical protein